MQVYGSVGEGDAACMSLVRGRCPRRRGVGGNIVGVIGVGQDITEMRRLMKQEALLAKATRSARYDCAAPRIVVWHTNAE